MIPFATDMLAQVPEAAPYVSVAKLIALVVLFSLWCLFAQWVDKDALAVNTWRVPWNLAVMSAGIVTLAVWLLVPLFLVGLLIYFVVNAGLMAAYVIHRNGLVTDESKVFTPAHFKRLTADLLAGKKKQKAIKQRVQLRDAQGRSVEVPTEPAARQQYSLTQDLLFDALWRRASVVDITPAGQASRIVYEIDGVATERQGLPRADAESVLLYFKTLAGLNLEEKRKPQSGSVTAEIGENKTTITVQTGGSTAGEKLTLRMIGRETEFKIDDLGLTKEQLETLRGVMHGDKGLTIISGPPGSGVSVTTYAVARSHDAFLNNIQTLELNKEYTLFNITQRVFTPAEDRTWGSELQKIVRTDPDIIILPQPPDAAGAAVLAKAAAEKQRIYVALPAEDTLDALRRWMELVNEKKLVARSLRLVMNQRLVRRLCGECKQAYRPDAQMLRKANLPADSVFHRPPEPQYDKHGNPIICQNCQGTGYCGRTAIFDLLTIDDGLRGVIQQGGSVADIRAYLTKKGVGGLQQQALAKVIDGTTSIQEVIRVTRRPAAKGNAAPARPKPTSDSGAPTPSAR